MKSRLFLFILYLIFYLQVSAEENTAQLGNQAKAFAETLDLTRSSLLYEELSNRTLPDWQHALVLYDWGTVKLLQQEWQQALHLFYRIPPSSIFSPLLLRSLTLNKAVAYLGYAQLLATLTTQNTLDEQLYLTWLGIKELKEASTIDCRIQKMEQDSSTCVPAKDLTTLLKKALLTLDQIKQKQRSQFLLSAAPTSLWTILKIALNNFSKQLLTLERTPTPQKSTYTQILLAESKTLFPLWDQLKSEIAKEDQSNIEEALKSYSDAIVFLEKQEFEQAQKSLHNSAQIIEKMTASTPLEILLLHYQLLLLKDINESTVQALINEQTELVFKGPQKENLEKATSFLNKSLPAIQEGDLFKARFYIIYSQSILENEALEAKEETTPLFILKHALQTALTAQQLTQLAHLAETSHADLISIIKQQQDNTLNQAASFLPAVSNAQKSAFSNQKGSHCQNHPWDQVIPLFEKGYLAAKQTKTWMALQPLQALALFDQQKQTIKNWQQALKLLEQASSSAEPEPDQNQPPQNEESQQSSAKEDLNETLQMIQEMQSQDQPQEKGQTQQEGHSW